VTNWYLITGLLNFDVLITFESAGADVHDEVSFDIVRLALITGALNQRIKLLLVNCLVHFKAARLTRVDSYFHEWLDVGGSCDDTAHSDQGTNLLSANFSHFCDLLFSKLARHNN